MNWSHKMSMSSQCQDCLPPKPNFLPTSQLSGFVESPTATLRVSMSELNLLEAGGRGPVEGLDIPPGLLQSMVTPDIQPEYSTSGRHVRCATGERRPPHRENPPRCSPTNTGPLASHFRDNSSYQCNPQARHYDTNWAWGS